MKTNYVVVLGLLCTSVLNAQLINVPADHATIQAAIEASSDGDTVLVEEGTFTENINFMGKAITLASRFILDGDTAHISKTIIDGSQPAHPDTASVVLMISGEDTTSVLMGFTITGGSGSQLSSWIGPSEVSADLLGGGISIVNCGGKICYNIIEENHLTDPQFGSYTLGGGILANINHMHSAIIRRNLIRNNSISGYWTFGGGVSLIGGRIILEENMIIDNSLNSEDGSFGTGLAWFGMDTPGQINEAIIRDNVIDGNISSGNPGNMGGAVYSWGRFPDTRVQIYNNVISNNYNPGPGGGISSIVSRLAFYNNTVWNNESETGGNSIYLDETNMVMYNNIIWSEAENDHDDIHMSSFFKSNIKAYNNILMESVTSSMQIEGDQNTYMKPVFANDTTLGPAENSPAIGRGLDSLQIGEDWYFAPMTDITGNTRPNSIDSFGDLGARESGFSQSLFSSAELIDIVQEGYILDPVFDPDINSYKIDVPGIFMFVAELKGVPVDMLSEVEIDFASNIFSEEAAERTSTISASSSDGSAEKTFTVEYVPKSSEAKLNSLSINLGELDPAFDTDITEYTALLPYGTTSPPTISCEVSHPKATYEVTNAINLNSVIEAYRRSVVKVISEFGEPYSRKYKITFSIAEEEPSGIEGGVHPDNFKIYPNPFSKELTLECKTMKLIHRIDLLNVLGQSVRTIHQPSADKITIPRGNLPSGIYFIKLHTADSPVFRLIIE